MNHCVECQKSQVREHRKNNDHVRDADNERYHNTKHLTAKARLIYSQDYVIKYPWRYKANTAVNNAVKDGKLVKPLTCSECGSDGMIHGHHDNYAEPLIVRWLCARCHSAWHQENGEAPNGF